MNLSASDSKKPSLLRSLSWGIAIVLGILIFAYGFEVTEVDLAETREPQRQESLRRILRALAHPEIFEYEKEEFIVTTPIWIACPPGGVEVPEPDPSLPYLIITPPCADPNAEITIEGFNFEPGTEGPINLVPPSGVKLPLGKAEPDAEGHFIITTELPNRQPLDEPQEIRVTTRRNVGSPHLSKNALDTWDKIVETVFIALLATTLGTILAVPISFFAARNLMKEVTSPLASTALALIGWPLGVWAGLQVAQWVEQAANVFTSGVAMNLGGMFFASALGWGAARWAMPATEDRPSPAVRVLRFAGLLSAGFLGAVALRLLANLAFTSGSSLAKNLGAFAFLGTFLNDIGEISGLLVTMILVLGGGALFGSLGGRMGHTLSERLPKNALKLLNVPLGAISGALLFAMLGAVADWFYQYENPILSIWGPAGVGAALGLVIAVRAWQADVLSTGLAIYTVTRTILNLIRSIEALVWVIIFVVWVSIGPFPGVLALALHTVASLAKLYSEQIESIAEGPLEAVKATGATRLQMIIYAVIPQIIPPYIAFTIYRWDINVRMSTILGFAGGGGIGFLLLQNVGMLEYRAASTQMLAIAIVVATMDYLSSWLREKVI